MAALDRSRRRNVYDNDADWAGVADEWTAS
jgi:hypothetical protein